MKFLRKREDYVSPYNKEETKKLLLEDKRVAKVNITKNGMVIHTAPLIPKGKNKAENMISAFPVGTYRIQLYGKRTVTVYIRRKQGAKGEGYHHPHIHPSYGYEHGDRGTCFGTLLSEMQVLKENKDWFWLAKRSLDLLDDFNFSTYGKTVRESWVDWLMDYQINYNRNNKEPLMEIKRDMAKKGLIRGLRSYSRYPVNSR